MGGIRNSAIYSEHARLLALRAALNVAQSPPRGFEAIVAEFFKKYGPKLVADCEEDLSERRAERNSEGFRKVLSKTLLPRLRERWPVAHDGGTSVSGSSDGPSDAKHFL